MTTEIEDRRRRRGGVLIVLVGGIIAAWLVYLWLEGLDSGDGSLAASSATTTTAQPAATTTTAGPATTTTVVPTTTTLARDVGAIESGLAELRRLEIERFGTRVGEPDRFADLFATPGEPAFGLTRIDQGNVLFFARLGAQDDVVRVLNTCNANFPQGCELASETTADTNPLWLDGLIASFGEVGNVRILGIGVVGGRYNLLGQVASDETKQRIGDAVAAAIAPDLTLVNELEVVDSGVITDATETALDDIDLQGITFESGSAEITAEGRAVLDEAVAVLANAIGVTVEVGGHTDNAGGAASNQRLGQARAESVVTYLVDGGVEVAILTAVGYGEEQPIADNATPEGREQNRRIEFSVSPA